MAGAAGILARDDAAYQDVHREPTPDRLSRQCGNPPSLPRVSLESDGPPGGFPVRRARHCKWRAVAIARHAVRPQRAGGPGSLLPFTRAREVVATPTPAQSRTERRASPRKPTRSKKSELDRGSNHAWTVRDFRSVAADNSAGKRC